MNGGLRFYTDPGGSAIIDRCAGLSINCPDLPDPNIALSSFIPSDGIEQDDTRLLFGGFVQYNRLYALAGVPWLDDLPMQTTFNLSTRRDDISVQLWRQVRRNKFYDTMAVEAIHYGGGHRGAVSALVSALVHGILLSILATTSVQIATRQRDIIPLVIRDPAPPAPPPGGSVGAGAPAPVAVPVEPPKLVDQPKPIEAPQPIGHPRIAAKPKPKDVPHRVPTPFASSPPRKSRRHPRRPAAISAARSPAASSAALPAAE